MDLSINSDSQEASCINQNFSQMVLDPEAGFWLDDIKISRCGSIEENTSWPAIPNVWLFLLLYLEFFQLRCAQEPVEDMDHPNPFEDEDAKTTRIGSD